jgi:hypothetical protein
MTTAAQVEANRQNALNSTGPQSDDGKEQSRFNATTHGCTSRILTDELKFSAAFQERYQALMAEIQPETTERIVFLELAVMASIQTRTALESLDNEIDQQKEAAQNHWEETQRHKAKKLMAKLGRNPGVVSAELEGNRAGCQLMIEAWQTLKDVAADSGEWNDDHVTTACDLLGIRSALRVGMSRVRPKAPEGRGLHQQALAQAEIDRLESAIDRWLTDADENERLKVLHSSRSLLSPEAQRYIRYLHTASGRFDRYLAIASGKKPLPIPRMSRPKPQPATVAPTVAPCAPTPPPPPDPTPERVETNLVNPFHLMREAMIKLGVEAKRERMTSKKKREAHHQLILDHAQLVMEYIEAANLTQDDIAAEMKHFNKIVIESLLKSS